MNRLYRVELIDENYYLEYNDKHHEIEIFIDGYVEGFSLFQISDLIDELTTLYKIIEDNTPDLKSKSVPT